MTKRTEYQVYLQKCFVEDREPLSYEEWLQEQEELRNDS
jgi:hypothetical protein